MRRLLFWLVFVPLAAIIVLFAVANRTAVTVSFDPFSGENSALAFTLPLFIVIFLSIVLGVILGGVVSLRHRYRMWRAVRHAEEEAERHKAEADTERKARETMLADIPAIGPPP